MKDILEEALEICAEYEDIDANGNANDWMRVSMLITEAMQYAKKQHSGEPVAWRLRKEGMGYSITCYSTDQVNTYIHQGWQIIDALYTTPQPVVDVNQKLVEDKYEKLEPALESLVDLCNNLNIGTYDEVIAAEAALERLYLARKALLSAGKEMDRG
jgi:hypothetical protein